jgi:hypothetical protein
MWGNVEPSTKVRLEAEYQRNKEVVAKEKAEYEEKYGKIERKKKKKRIQESWNFSLYNVYGRENAYRITFQDDPKNLSRTQIIQTSLFRWVPSITYQFKF